MRVLLIKKSTRTLFPKITCPFLVATENVGYTIWGLYWDISILCRIALEDLLFRTTAWKSRGQDYSWEFRVCGSEGLGFNFWVQGLGFKVNCVAQDFAQGSRILGRDLNPKA